MKWKIIGLAALAVAAVMVAAFALTRPEVNPAPVATQTVKQPTTSVTPTVAPIPTPTAAPAPKLTFQPGAKAVFFGDSWTYGQGINPPQLSFAYVSGDALELNYEVDGGPGTGYVNRGPSNLGDYAERINAYPASDATLVVIQGSTNDETAAGTPNLAASVERALDAAKLKFPNAQVVLVGPAAHMKSNAQNMRMIDNVLRTAATTRSLNYVSPVAEQWITTQNMATVIDAATNHPSIEGHKYLSDKLVAALNALR